MTLGNAWAADHPRLLSPLNPPLLTAAGTVVYHLSRIQTTFYPTNNSWCRRFHYIYSRYPTVSPVSPAVLQIFPCISCTEM